MEIETHHMISRGNTIVLVDFASSSFEVGDLVRIAQEEPWIAGYAFLQQLSDTWAGFETWAGKPDSLPADLDITWPPKYDDDETGSSYSSTQYSSNAELSD